MTSLSPRGPLPARVYWRRRLLVLAVAAVLVVGLARVLGGGSDGSSDKGGAAVLAGSPTSGSTSAITEPTRRPSRTPSATPTTTAPTTTAPVLAAPSGPCADRDVAVTPSVSSAIAGPRHGVRIVLDLRTVSAEACTWRVSPRTLTLKVTSGRDDIWSTRDCPRAVPAQDVVVRKAVSTQVTLGWDGRRSDEDCSRQTDWALPGYYHVAAAALTGEPAKVQFELDAPTAPTVTRTAKPKQAPAPGRKNRQGAPSAPVEEPLGGSPSGAVEPD